MAAADVTWAYAIREHLMRWVHFGTLSLSLLGSQVVWSLELAYGTPYLLSLGLSKEATGYVWIAGPLSGLIMQPVLGSLSDSSMSQFRRRKYMLGSCGVVALATCLIAFSEPISLYLLDIVGIGLGDWDPSRHKHAKRMTQVLSVLGFWILDFAINGLQVISRALILDHADASQQNEANAWHGRMLHAGSIIGYWCGWVDLSTWPSLAWIGGGQFRRFAVVSAVCMVICVSITCLFTPEYGTKHTTTSPEGLITRIGASVRQVVRVGRALPVPIQRVCLVELLATMSWFPFLFYSTTYVLDMAHRKHKRHSDADHELGSFAMLCFALLAMVSGLVLPSLSLAGKMRPPLLETLPPTSSSRRRVRGMSLRTLWTFGSLLQAVLMLSTFFIYTQKQAILLVMLMGVPWSVWMWVPYAMIGEFVREAERSSMFQYSDEQWPAQRIMEHQRSSTHESIPTQRPHPYPKGFDATSQRSVSGPYGPSIVSRGPDVVRPDENPALLEESACGGTILGIHNLSIVLPQFLVALIASLIFRSIKDGQGDVAWVFRFGGVMALGAAILTRLVPLTLSERKVRHIGYTLLPDEEEAGGTGPDDTEVYETYIDEADDADDGAGDSMVIRDPKANVGGSDNYDVIKGKRDKSCLNDVKDDSIRIKDHDGYVKKSQTSEGATNSDSTTAHSSPPASLLDDSASTDRSTVGDP